MLRCGEHITGDAFGDKDLAMVADVSSWRVETYVPKAHVNILVLALAHAITGGTQNVFDDLNPASHRIGREGIGRYLVTSKRIKTTFKAIRARGEGDRNLGDNSGFTARGSWPTRLAMVR